MLRNNYNRPSVNIYSKLDDHWLCAVHSGQQQLMRPIYHPVAVGHIVGSPVEAAVLVNAFWQVRKIDASTKCIINDTTVKWYCLFHHIPLSWPFKYARWSFGCLTEVGSCSESVLFRIFTIPRANNPSTTISKSKRRRVWICILRLKSLLRCCDQEIAL